MLAKAHKAAGARLCRALALALFALPAWGAGFDSPLRSVAWAAMSEGARTAVVLGCVVIPAVMLCLLAAGGRAPRRLGIALVGVLALLWSGYARLAGTVWYVGDSSSEYGAEDGTTAATAYDGSAGITWGPGGVVAGDTLCVIGDWDEELAIAQSGSAGNVITIDLECPGHEATFNGSFSIKGQTWTEITPNSWRCTACTSDQAAYALWVNGRYAIKETVSASSVSAGPEWYSVSGGNIFLYGTENPNNTWDTIRLGDSRNGISIDGFDYIKINGGRFEQYQMTRNATYVTDYGHGSSQKYVHGQGAIFIKNASNIEVTGQTFHQVGIAVAAAVPTISDISIHDISMTEVTANANGALTLGIPRNSGFGIVAVGTDIDIYNITYDGRVTYADGNTYREGLPIFVGYTDELLNKPTRVDIYNNTLEYFDTFAIFFEDLYPLKGSVLDCDCKIYGNTIRYSSFPTAFRDSDGIGIGGNDAGGVAGYQSSYTKNVDTFRNYIEQVANAGINYANYQGIESEVYGNICLNCGVGSWTADDRKSCFRISNGVDLLNNTCQQTGDYKSTSGDGIVALRATGFTAAQQNTAKNNALIGMQASGEYAIRGIASGDLAGSHNAIYDVTNDYNNFTNMNSISADPAFVGGPNPTTAEGFRPSATSPLVGAGTDVGSVQDFFGDTYYSSPDIGAFRRDSCYRRSRDGKLDMARTRSQVVSRCLGVPGRYPEGL